MSAVRSERTVPHRLLVAAPYPEGATMAIARAASASGRLEGLITSQLLPARFAPSLPRQLRRLTDADPRFDGVPAGLLSRVTGGYELLRVAARALPGGYGTAGAAMYLGKRRFDEAVAARIGPGGAVVGVFASASATFARARGLGRRTILNCVNSHPSVHNEVLERWRVPARWEYVPPAAVRGVAAELDAAEIVLAPSRYVADGLTAAGVPDDRVHIVPYGVDLDRFSPASIDRPASRRLAVVFVGQVSYRKGVSVLVETARQLVHEADFTLIGPLVSPRCLRRAGANVHRLATTGHRRLPDLLRRADVFVLPSLDDAYPLAALEAMACGLPVVVSDHTGTAELIRTWENGVVVPAGKPEELASALERLGDASLRAEIGGAGRRTVEREHSWADYGDRALAVADA